MSLGALYSLRGAPLRPAALVLLVQSAVGILLLAVFQTYLTEDLGAGLAYPGYAIACYSIVKLTFHAPAGYLADRFGRRPTLVGGVALTMPVLVLMLLVEDAPVFLGLAALYGLAIAAIWPSIYALLAESFASSERGRALAVLNTGYLLGLGLGAAGGAFITDLVSARAAIAVCLGLNALAMLVAATPGMKSGRYAPAAEGRDPPLRLLLPALRDPGILWLAALIVLVGTGTTMMSAVVRAYAVQALDITLSSFVVYLLPPAALAALFFVPAGRLADVFGRFRPLAAGVGLCGAGLVMMGLFAEPVAASASAGLALIGYAMIHPSWTAALMDRVGDELRATLLGAVTGLHGLAGSVGPALGGTIGQELGPDVTFQVAGVLLLSSVPMVLAAFRAEQRRGPTPDEQPV